MLTTLFFLLMSQTNLLRAALLVKYKLEIKFSFHNSAGSSCRITAVLFD